MPNAPEIINQQAVPNSPVPEGLSSTTNALLPAKQLIERLNHFPEEVYSLAPESHLVRFLKVLLGDAGAGQIRKRFLLARLQQTLQGSHFFDLDHFYGALFGLRRSVAEALDVDPYNDTATSATWDAEHAKDASYRSRISQFARSIGYGATPTGMELASEAVLSVDCDVLESYIQSEANLRTYAELEIAYPTYDDLEGLTYNELAGVGMMATIAGAERKQFTVRPHRPITLDESYDLSRVLDRLRPADSRFVIDWHGAATHLPISLGGVASDSEFWEVITEVAGSPLGAINPYQVTSTTPVEQPRPPFTAHQGEAWTVLGDLAGMVAYSVGADGMALIPTQRVVLQDGTYIDYEAQQAVQSVRQILAGRAASDSVLVSSPYAGSRRILQQPFIGLTDGSSRVPYQQSGTPAPLFVDRIPIDLLIQTLDQVPQLTPSHANADQRFWASPPRAQNDPTQEIVEFRLNGVRRVNYATFSVARFPHTATFEIFNEDTGEWDEVARKVITDSIPSILRINPNNDGHPQHIGGEAHWVKCSVKVPARSAQRFRVILVRGPGTGPRNPRLYWDRNFSVIPYSLAVQSVDVGYRVESRADLNPDPTDTLIGTTTDILGSIVHHRALLHPASGAVTETIPWKSDAQPVHYAVVNFFANTTSPDGEGQVIDRFFVDPIHTGVHCTLYYSNDPGDPTDEGFVYENLMWTPIPRDYVLQKGFMYLPPTKARFFKFEFTNLVAESFETLVPITRVVKVFPASLVQQWVTGLFSGQGDKAMPAGTSTHIDANFTPKFGDATLAIDLSAQSAAVQYRATEALISDDLVASINLAQNTFWFRFLSWQQGHYAPRFLRTSVHRYTEVEVEHSFKVGFFVGLNSLRAYRVSYQADNDPEVYVDRFFDTQNISPAGFTWELDPNQLGTGESNTALATSKALVSQSDVQALQFATQQTEPLQLVPDDDFRDPALLNYDWSDQDNWHTYGDAVLLYQANDNTVTIQRYSQPPPKVLTHTVGPVQPLVNPVYDYRDLTVDDEEAAARTVGGIESGLMSPSTAGRIWAAARVIADTSLTSPYFIQIVALDGTVLAEKSQMMSKGQMAEWYVGYDIGDFYHPPPPVKFYQPRSLIDRPIHPVANGDPATEIPQPPAPPPPNDSLVRIRLIQKGKSDDTISLDTFSLFDEGIVWEFSVNGGANFYPGRGIRNNEDGVLVFPEPGNALVWRVRGVRPHMVVSSLKIRPWYVGVHNARANGTHRGPNVSVYDHYPPINEDPEFTGWTKPIPRWWFYISRRFPILPVVGIPNVTQFSKFYARHGVEDISGGTDTADRLFTAARTTVERLDLTASDTATHDQGVFVRIISDGSLTFDTPVVFKMHPPPAGGILNVPLHPTWST